MEVGLGGQILGSPQLTGAVLPWAWKWAQLKSPQEAFHSSPAPLLDSYGISRSVGPSLGMPACWSSLA